MSKARELSKLPNYVLSTVAELKLTVGKEQGDKAFVGGYYADGDGGGGDFYWDAVSVEADNGGTIFQVTGITTGRWKRIYSGSVNVKWFGAKGDGVTDDTVAIQNAINNAHYCVLFPNAIYLTSFIDLSLITKDIYIELDNSTIIQGLQYVRLASDTTVTRTIDNQIILSVIDTTKITIGTNIRSSFAFGDGGLETDGLTVVSKTTNTVTVKYASTNSITDGSTVVIPSGAFIGNFSWTRLIYLGSTYSVQIKNGTIKETFGYWISNCKAHCYCENIEFTLRGLDGFNLQHPDCLMEFNSCSFGQSMDIAKQTFFILDGSNLKFEGCRFNSSNYDGELAFSGNYNYPDAYSSLYISNCKFNGANTTVPNKIFPYTNNMFHCIEFSTWQGNCNFLDIQIYNSSFDNYERGMIGTRVDELTHNLSIGNVTINGIRCDVPFGIIMGNNITVDVSNFAVSDSSFYLPPDEDSYFTSYSLSSASRFLALWSNCTFRIQNNKAIFQYSHLDSCVFDSCKLITNDISKTTFDNIYMRGTGSGITLSPSNDILFDGGCDGLVILDTPDFPLNIASIFTGLNDKYGQLCTLKSVRGGALYNVSTYDTSVILAGDFRVPTSGQILTYTFKGDDWYIPDNSAFYAGASLIGRAINSHILTSSSAYTTGTTAITVVGYVGYPFVASGDYINIVLANGLVFTTTIASNSGYDFVLTSGIPSNMLSAANICTFKKQSIAYT